MTPILFLLPIPKPKKYRPSLIEAYSPLSQVSQQDTYHNHLEQNAPNIWRRILMVSNLHALSRQSSPISFSFVLLQGAHRSGMESDEARSLSLHLLGLSNQKRHIYQAFRCFLSSFLVLAAVCSIAL